MSKTTQTTPQADEGPAFRETVGVLAWHEEPGETVTVLHTEALRRINTALTAIRACADLLNHRESELGQGIPTLCNTTAHGLLAAIRCASELVDAHVNDSSAEGIYKLKDGAAKEVHSAASRVWHRQFTG